MDAENLRNIYNQYFSQGSSAWSSTDLKKTRKVVERTLYWLRKSGFSKANASVLDIGCATGYYTESFRLTGCNSLGLDYSEIAVEQAAQRFPSCRFVQMNGFEPSFEEEFDVAFCRGFSGVNTHDLEFIARWVNKYMRYISAGGYFVLAYSSDFSGKEKSGETVNLSRSELSMLVTLINGEYKGTHIFYYFGFVSKVKRAFEKYILRKNVKDYFYILIQKSN
jgi:SAM-dependent methyltransferase